MKRDRVVAIRPVVAGDSHFSAIAIAREAAPAGRWAAQILAALRVSCDRRARFASREIGTPHKHHPRNGDLCAADDRAGQASDQGKR